MVALVDDDGAAAIHAAEPEAVGLSPAGSRHSVTVAIQHGAARRPIRVELESGAPDAVTISVSNEGTIASTLLQHLFEPFRSSRSDHRRSEGLGLGLYIDQVVKAHHGRVEVRSTLEQGTTTFEIRLPRALASLPGRAPHGAVEPT